jgi:hypothetical protein
MTLDQLRAQRACGLCLGLLFLSIAAPRSAAAQRTDEKLRTGEKIQAKAITPPRAVNNIAATLRAMGRTDVADRFIRDFENGIVLLGNPGSNATTDPPVIVPMVTNRKDNIMTLDRSTLISQCDTKATDRSPVSPGTLSWALTVVHEYVHMEQDNPLQIPRFENTAWRQAIDENQKWIRLVMFEIGVVELRMPDSPEKLSRLKELTATLDNLRRVHDGSINSLKDEIQAGHVGAGVEWPRLDYGGDTDPGRVAKDASAQIDRNLTNARHDIDRLQRLLDASTVAKNPPPKPKPAPATPPTGRPQSPARVQRTLKVSVQGWVGYDHTVTFNNVIWDSGQWKEFGTFTEPVPIPDGSTISTTAQVTCWRLDINGEITKQRVVSLRVRGICERGAPSTRIAEEFEVEIADLPLSNEGEGIYWADAAFDGQAGRAPPGVVGPLEVERYVRKLTYVRRFNEEKQTMISVDWRHLTGPQARGVDPYTHFSAYNQSSHVRIDVH